MPARCVSATCWQYLAAYIADVLRSFIACDKVRRLLGPAPPGPAPANSVGLGVLCGVCSLTAHVEQNDYKYYPSVERFNRSDFQRYKKYLYIFIRINIYIYIHWFQVSFGKGLIYCSYRLMLTCFLPSFTYDCIHTAWCAAASRCFLDTEVYVEPDLPCATVELN